MRHPQPLRALPGWEAPPPLDRRRLQSYLGLLLGDVVALFAGFGAAGWLYRGWLGFSDAAVDAVLVMPMFLIVALYNGAYSLGSLERPAIGIVRALAALLLAFAIVIFIAFYAKASAGFSRFAFSLGGALAALAMVWTRLQLRAWVHWRCGPRVLNQLLIDDGGSRLELPGVPVLSAAGFGLNPNLSDPAALDRIGLALHNVDAVIVTCPPERRGAWAAIFKGANINAEVIDEQVAELQAIGARQAGGNGLLQVSAGPLGLRARAAKRLLDLIVASFGLVILGPLMAVLAMAIWLEDGAPVVFAQLRVGRANRFFTMYKFRSMRSAAADAAGNQSTGRADPRITRIGRWIRRTSIDELPQLFNVLIGDMSIVGPRPHALGSLAGDKPFWEIDPRYWQRHALRPGMTGLAQVRGLRGATEAEGDLAGRLSADLEYVNGWSLGRDIRIICATLRVLVHEKAF